MRDVGNWSGDDWNGNTGSEECQVEVILIRQRLYVKSYGHFQTPLGVYYSLD